jgi:hypothetical protein
MSKRWLVAAACLWAPLALAGSETRNGGGGVRRDGSYLTFGSAGYQVRMTPLRAAPGLWQIENALRELPMDQTTRSRLVNAVSPGERRRYFGIDEVLSPEKERELKEVYRKVLPPVSEHELAFFALTSPERRETYLLPAFFWLQPAEQSAILLHEALWVIDPKLSYELVVQAEIQFQKYLESGARDPIDFYRTLDEVFGDHTISLKAALIHDRRTGVFPGRRLPLSQLLGQGSVKLDRCTEALECGIASFGAAIVNHLDQWRASEPASRSAKRLFELRELLAVGAFDQGRAGRVQLKDESEGWIDLDALEQSLPGEIPVQYNYGPESKQVVITARPEGV